MLLTPSGFEFAEERLEINVRKRKIVREFFIGEISR